MIVRRRFRFEAAHHLPHHPGKCKKMHGHSYELVVAVDRAVDGASGMVIDFSDLKRIVREQVVGPLDHRLVNDVMPNPTAELMAHWIWRRLSGKLEGLVEVELHETRDCSVVYRGD